MEYLVGYTGFVGSNIYESHHFDGLFNSKNIKEAYGRNPDLLVYSGVPAQKFIANSNPSEDMCIIEKAKENIQMINPKEIILISTIDVYKEPQEVYEDSEIMDDNEPYGKNRYLLEKWVMDNFDNYLIVRLPGLYGNNIKKNFIYDLINIIPSMLTYEKYEEIKNPLIINSYEDNHNGFYKLKDLNNKDKKALKNYFCNNDFNALSFTDSRSSFQFYNLKNLWKDITIARENNIHILNLATEPITASSLYESIMHKEFVNHLNKRVARYNYKTRYDKIFGGKNGYIATKEEILEDIIQFVKEKSL